MPESPLKLLRNGQVANLPWMTGLTSEEGSFFNWFHNSKLFGSYLISICI